MQQKIGAKLMFWAELVTKAEMDENDDFRK